MRRASSPYANTTRCRAQTLRHPRSSARARPLLIRPLTAPAAQQPTSRSLSSEKTPTRRSKSAAGSRARPTAASARANSPASSATGRSPSSVSTKSAVVGAVSSPGKRPSWDVKVTRARKQQTAQRPPRSDSHLRVASPCASLSCGVSRHRRSARRAGHDGGREAEGGPHARAPAGKSGRATRNTLARSVCLVRPPPTLPSRGVPHLGEGRGAGGCAAQGARGRRGGDTVREASGGVVHPP